MGELQKIPELGIGKDFETAVTKLENDLKSIADGKHIIAGTKEKPIVNDSDQIPIDHFLILLQLFQNLYQYQILVFFVTLPFN